MTPSQEMELGGQLRGLPRFAEWLAEWEAREVVILKCSQDMAAIHQSQGRAQFIDRIKNMLASSNKYPR